MISSHVHSTRLCHLSKARHSIPNIWLRRQGGIHLCRKEKSSKQKPLVHGLPFCARHACRQVREKQEPFFMDEMFSALLDGRRNRVRQSGRSQPEGVCRAQPRRHPARTRDEWEPIGARAFTCSGKQTSAPVRGMYCRKAFWRPFRRRSDARLTVLGTSKCRQSTPISGVCFDNSQNEKQSPNSARNMV